ncbi:Sterile alpha motif domain-containing protein 13 [Trichinella zimbabwensis]|uniref:Sterile alpha motif domain-containing protein 13 n=1 Tax=Trichinella zimbabwensis TaxID=268475 RepID=A0A0V1H4S8_9BILA|nr:Sterile alpha motif domain-containing protein 13 [Trichinella zimbabwensis]
MYSINNLFEFLELKGYTTNYCEMVFNSSIKNQFKDRFNLPSLENDTIIMKAAKSNLNEWTVKDVSNFVAKLGFEKEALVFEQNFIDGCTLMLLEKEFIVNDLKIPFGRALKLYRRINTLQIMISKNNIKC